MENFSNIPLPKTVCKPVHWKFLSLTLIIVDETSLKLQLQVMINFTVIR